MKRMRPERIPAGKRKGLTLIGLMLIIALIGIVLTWGLGKIPPHFLGTTSTEARTAQNELVEIMKGLEKYRQDNGTYPSSEQGLLSLVLRPNIAPVPSNWQTGGYIKRLPRDPWGNSYQYQRTGNDIVVFSYGPQGPEHGLDDDDNSVIRLSNKR